MDTKAANLYAAETAADAAAEAVAGRYRIRRIIGRGRLGEIYEASDERQRDLGVERYVAVQLLPDSIAFSDAAFTRLKAGFGGLLARSHPSIVAYLDIDRDKRFGYIVMERLEGASLRKVLDLETTLELADVSAVVAAIGAALEFLHGKSIVHGNVSPRNVFVTDDLEFRLLDIVPIPAPASGSGRTIDTGIADDLYDLACLTYEMLAGKHPYNFRDRANAARSGIAPDRIQSLPDREWRALERALTFDAARKPAAIAEFVREFCTGRTARRAGAPGTNAVARAPTADRPAPTAARARDVSSARAGQPLAPRTPGRRRRAGKRPRETGSLILFLVLIALGAWFSAGRPQADAGNLLNAIGPPVPKLGEPSAPTAETVSPVTVAPARPAGDGPAVTEPASVATGSETATDAADGPAANDASSPLAGNNASAADESATDATAGAEALEPAAPEFDATFVTVSESDVAARVSLRLPETPTATRYFWWTRPHGASAEQDYVATAAQLVRADDAEQSATLLVPLVNDGRPEPVEDFFVHVGTPDADGRFVPADTIRVDIVDDD